MKNIKIIIILLSSLFCILWAKAQTLESSTITDIDSNVYKTVVIGRQIWMTENLRTTTYRDGNQIQLIEDSTWSRITSGAYCWYDNNLSNALKYGALYNWYAVNTGNLCPTAWRVPSDEDWKYLEGYIDSRYRNYDSIWNDTMLRGYDAGKVLKGKLGWNLNGNGLDLYGFSALPAGERSINKLSFRHIGNNGFWWTSNESDSTNSWYRCLVFFDERIIRNTHPKGMGFSVRCMKNL